MGGNARLAADFVADVTDELGVGCGCCGGARLVAGGWGNLVGGFRGLEKPGFYRDLGLFASIGEKNPVSGEWFGLEKPGFYEGLGLVVNIGEKNPVSGRFNNRRFVF